MYCSSFKAHCMSLGIKHGHAQVSTAVLNHPSTGVLTQAQPCSCNLARPCTRLHGRVSPIPIIAPDINMGVLAVEHGRAHQHGLVVLHSGFEHRRAQ